MLKMVCQSSTALMAYSNLLSTELKVYTLIITRVNIGPSISTPGDALRVKFDAGLAIFLVDW